MLGSHLSISGGMVNALLRAEEFNLDCVQVFTKNQRQWRVPPLDPGAARDWLDKLRDMNWHRLRGPVRVVSHNSYLINMASPDADAWQRSIDLQRVELERCEALRIRLCVAHPGAHLGTPRARSETNTLDGRFTRDELAGMKRIVKALDRLHADLPGYRVRTCLETTVGSGTNLGYDFHQLRWIREHAAEPDRIAFCFDTCHVTAGGYDMSTDRTAKQVLRSFDTTCGIRNLRVLHMNDSVGPLGSRRDRHAHIGDGACGISCFRTILNRRALDAVPKVLETEKGTAADGRDWDSVNISRLKRLAGPHLASR